SMGGMMVVVNRRRRLEADLRRIPTEPTLEPAASERQANQRAHGFELPQEVRHGDEAEKDGVGRKDERPDDAGDGADEDERDPSAGGQHRPGLPPIDAPQAPGDEGHDGQKSYDRQSVHPRPRNWRSAAESI